VTSVSRTVLLGLSNSLRCRTAVLYFFMVWSLENVEIAKSFGLPGGPSHS